MRVNGIDLTPWSKNSRRIIAAIALAYPGKVKVRDLIPVVYPDPDKEPDWAADSIKSTIFSMRRVWSNPDWRIASVPSSSGGYWLERVGGER